MDVVFYYGLSRGTLESQANEQGYTLGEYADIAQKIMEMLITCRLHELITESEHHIILVRLQKRMFGYLRKMEDRK